MKRDEEDRYEVKRREGGEEVDLEHGRWCEYDKYRNKTEGTNTSGDAQK